MYTIIDEDEFETIYDSRRCSSCDGNLRKCNGACNGSVSFGTRQRSKEDIAKIKADRIRKEEDEILAKAEAIRASRLTSFARPRA